MLTTRTDAFGNKYWYNHNGWRHREDGPACEYTDGSSQWWVNGELHRTDGPAVEWTTPNRTGWYINNNMLTPSEFADEVLDKETALLWKMSGYCWPFEFKHVDN
jgi:hypothetical protein